jgi:endonuclease YncB( thermonuclease family)
MGKVIKIKYGRKKVKLPRNKFALYAVVALLIGAKIYLDDNKIKISVEDANEVAISSLSNLRISDGDTIGSSSIKMRLYGIDAPELKQSCKDANGKSYKCGQTAKAFLQSLVTDSTICVTQNKDKYGRLIAVCYNGDQDINAKMVKNGHAVAYTRYSNDYVSEERYAKSNKLGIWQGKFTEPERYRIGENK